MKRLLIIFTLCACVVTLCVHAIRTRSEVKRLQDNMEVLSDTIRVSKSRTGALIYTVSELNLKLSEARKLREADLKELRDMKIREKDLRSMVKTQSETSGTIRTYLRDTIYIKDSTEVKAKSFRWSDTYLSQRGVISEDSIRIDYTYKDTYTIVEHTRYKGWWIFKRKAGTDYSIKPGNPKTVVKGMEVIQIRD